MNIDLLNGFYILVGVITIISLVYAIIVARRGSRRKMLTCDITPPLSLATVLPNKTGHRLSIVYEREGAEPINIKGAYLYFIRVANMGKEPIRREDLVEPDPLRLEVQNARVLDIADAGVSRNVINFSLSLPEDKDGIIISRLTFDFLDYKDGVLVRILTDSYSADIKVKGTIIGMPKGLYISSDLRNPRLIGFILWIASLFALISGFVYIAKYLSERFTHWWFAAIIFVCLLVSVPASLLWLSYVNSPDRKWASGLHLPGWFISRYEADRKSRKEQE